jgi:hypothetical protein
MTEEDILNKRRSRRAFFTFEDKIESSAYLHGYHESIPVTLLSISIGGISFTGNRFKFDSIIEGDTITLKDLNTPDPLGTIYEIDTIVKYIVKDPHSVRIVLGCEFNYLSDELENKIDSFVVKRLHEIGLTV